MVIISQTITVISKIRWDLPFPIPDLGSYRVGFPPGKEPPPPPSHRHFTLRPTPAFPTTYAGSHSSTAPTRRWRPEPLRRRASPCIAASALPDSPLGVHSRDRILTSRYTPPAAWISHQRGDAVERTQVERVEFFQYTEPSASPFCWSASSSPPPRPPYLLSSHPQDNIGEGRRVM
jgi:hypothetical protein